MPSSSTPDHTWIPANIPSTHRVSLGKPRPCQDAVEKFSWPCNPELQLAEFTASNGHKHCRYYCKTCGGTASDNVGKNKIEASQLIQKYDEIKSLLEKAKTDYQTWIDEQSRAIGSCQKAKWESWLDRYHKTASWTNRRDRYIQQLERYACELCGMDETHLDVHHISYENIGDGGKEHDSDLKALCRPCHQMIHLYNPYENHFKKYGFTTHPKWGEEFRVSEK